MITEADSRMVIDRKLREACWDIEDKTQVATEETAADGRADYVLLDARGRPLTVVEAKRLPPASGLTTRSCSYGQEFASGSFSLRLAASA
ncbi:MAG: hypothetical protein ABSE16_10370 [Verrucomicrobiota bacterium]|jgi:type I site-specific restriction endonuclease